MVCGVLYVAAAARGHGTWPGPYTGAAVGAMFGPCRRLVSGDAAVVRVVVCTGARPLVRILVRGGGVCMMFLMLEQSTLLFVGRQGFGAFVDAWPCRPLGFVVANGQCRVVIHAPQKGNPPAPVVMQGDAVSGYGFSPYRHGPSCRRCASGLRCSVRWCSCLSERKWCYWCRSWLRRRTRPERHRRPSLRFHR